MDGNMMATKSAQLVTLKSVFEQVGASHEMPKKLIDSFLTDVVSAVTSHLQHGAKIRMTGLGTLEVKETAARTGRKPPLLRDWVAENGQQMITHVATGCQFRAYPAFWL
jgi:nucleoid DNA-binding protein